MKSRMGNDAAMIPRNFHLLCSGGEDLFTLGVGCRGGSISFLLRDCGFEVGAFRKRLGSSYESNRPVRRARWIYPQVHRRTIEGMHIIYFFWLGEDFITKKVLIAPEGPSDDNSYFGSEDANTEGESAP